MRGRQCRIRLDRLARLCQGLVGRPAIREQQPSFCDPRLGVPRPFCDEHVEDAVGLVLAPVAMEQRRLAQPCGARGVLVARSLEFIEDRQGILVPAGAEIVVRQRQPPGGVGRQGLEVCLRVGRPPRGQIQQREGAMRGRVLGLEFESALQGALGGPRISTGPLKIRERQLHVGRRGGERDRLPERLGSFRATAPHEVDRAERRPGGRIRGIERDGLLDLFERRSGLVQAGQRVPEQDVRGRMAGIRIDGELRPDARLFELAVHEQERACADLRVEVRGIKIRCAGELDVSPGRITRLLVREPQFVVQSRHVRSRLQRLPVFDDGFVVLLPGDVRIPAGGVTPGARLGVPRAAGMGHDCYEQRARQT